MKLTVQDISNFPQLAKLELVAGRGGLKKHVNHCGILDYEYDKDVSKKYYDYNYQVDGGFLTLTTFLYAKKNPNLIYDAVKKLVAKNGSGLIIKNIFKLPISQNVIRYANHMNFPIFVLNDSYPFFEDIIVLISKAMEKYESVYYMEQKMQKLLSLSEDDIASAGKIASEINPSMQDDIISMYFRYKDLGFTANMYMELTGELERGGIIGPEDSIFLYKNGFFIIHSERHFELEDPAVLSQPYVNILNNANQTARENFFVGVSRIHHMREELHHAANESIYAAAFADKILSADGSNTAYFENLGSYRALASHTSCPSMQNYSQEYILPLELYDAEKNGSLLETVLQFVTWGGSLDKTGQAMNQHPNTIRYRLNRAGEILGLNPFSLGDYEKLALAARIHLWNKLQL